MYKFMTCHTKFLTCKNYNILAFKKIEKFQTSKFFKICEKMQYINYLLEYYYQRNKS